MGKKLPRWLPRAVAFCALALALLFYLTGMMWNRTGVSMPLYAEPENTIDVLYLGSSKSNAAIAPTQMYTAHGFTGYVMYSWSQPVWTSYYYMKDAFRRQSPAAVVLEGNDLLYARRDEAYTAGINSVNNENALLIPAGWNRLCLALTMGRVQTDHPGFFSTLSLGRYHANWKTLTAQDWLWPLWEPKQSTGKGYGPVYRTQAFDPPARPAVQPDSDIYPPCLEYLQKSIDFIRKKGAVPVVVFYPDVSYTAADLARIAYLRQVCAGQGVTVLDFTDPDTVAAAGLDYGADMGDAIHLNYRGAAKLSAWLADWLAQNCALPDHRGEAAYAHWADAVAAEELDLARMEMCFEKDFGAFLRRTADPQYITLVYAWGDMTAPPENGDTAASAANLAALKDTFTAFGLPADVLAESAAARLWVWQNGTFTAVEAYTAALGDVRVEASPGSVLIDGVEASYRRNGVNAVVLAADGSWSHAVTWAAPQNFTQFTA